MEKHSETKIKSVYPSWLLNYTDIEKVVQLHSTDWPVVRGGNYVIFLADCILQAPVSYGEVLLLLSEEICCTYSTQMEPQTLKECCNLC